jgi:hypothetical protein
MIDYSKVGAHIRSNDSGFIKTIAELRGESSDTDDKFDIVGDERIVRMTSRNIDPFVPLPVYDINNVSKLPIELETTVEGSSLARVGFSLDGTASNAATGTVIIDGEPKEFDFGKGYWAPVLIWHGQFDYDRFVDGSVLNRSGRRIEDLTTHFVGVAAKIGIRGETRPAETFVGLILPEDTYREVIANKVSDLEEAMTSILPERLSEHFKSANIHYSPDETSEPRNLFEAPKMVAKITSPYKGNWAPSA